MRMPPQQPRGPNLPPRGPTPPRGPAAAKPAASRTAPRRPPRKLPAWLARARNLVVSPSQEWTTIAGEFATTGSIYTRYVLPTAAIGPVASTLGTIAFGERSSLATLGDSYAMSVGDALTTGVLEYGLSLVGVWALAMLIDLLAPSLGAQRNPVQALKVAAYGSTPYWFAGALAVLPKLAPIGALLGFYSIRLFALGLALVLKVPRDKAAAYTLLASIGGIIVVLVIGALSRVFV